MICTVKHSEPGEGGRKKGRDRHPYTCLPPERPKSKSSDPRHGLRWWESSTTQSTSKRHWLNTTKALGIAGALEALPIIFPSRQWCWEKKIPAPESLPVLSSNSFHLYWNAQSMEFTHDNPSPTTVSLPYIHMPSKDGRKPPTQLTRYVLDSHELLLAQIFTLFLPSFSSKSTQLHENICWKSCW